jgi:hypothetical protein
MADSRKKLSLKSKKIKINKNRSKITKDHEIENLDDRNNKNSI